MTNDLFIDDDDFSLEIEADLPLAEAPVALVPFVEVLSPDFQLPLLLKFCPRQELKLAADQAASYALSIAVTGEEGLGRADGALIVLRASQAAIVAHFEDPAKIADALHKKVTSTRAEWLASPKAAADTVGRRIYDEQARLKAIADEVRRMNQEEADLAAKVAAAREAKAAESAHAPASVVQQLHEAAERATAPPVADVFTPVLKGSTPVTTWKCRVADTPATDEPNHDVDAMTPAQRLRVFELLRAILDGKAPIAAINLNWSLLNKRAGAEKGTFSMPGLESYSVGGTRTKAGRRV